MSDLREKQAKGGNPSTPTPRAQMFEINTLSSAYGRNLVNSATGDQININNYVSRKSYRFMVHLYSRHHTFNFRLALEPNSGGWHQAWQVFRDSEQEPMKQSIPDDFPTNTDGKVDFLLLPKTEENNANRVAGGI